MRPHFVTLMNYTTDNDINMCLGWIYLIKKFHKYPKITIFYIDTINPLFNQFEDITFIQINIENYIDIPRIFTRGYTEYKVIMHDFLSKIDMPFMFIDADAWVLDDVSDVIYECTKPITFTKHVNHKNFDINSVNIHFNENHKMYMKKPLLQINDMLNSGVFVQHSSIISYEGLLDTYINEDYCYIGLDQSLILQYFQNIDYTPYDDSLPQEYNTGWILNVDDENPFHITSPVLHNDVKIAHGYGRYEKFYTSWRTKSLWDYVMNEMINNDIVLSNNGELYE